MMLNHFTAPNLTSKVATQPGSSPSKPEDNTRPDSNISDPRFNINRPCIYERRLPGNAYITAHVQRLQHGYYSTPAVSDGDIDHVDFLGVSFVFHSPDTLNHRFRAATIRASLDSSSSSSSHGRSRSRTKSPRFLMHAPHLLYGSVSPETLQWSYSLSGSLGIAHLPLVASISPAGGMNGIFRRYEMMRIQGSVRTLGPNPAGQIVWTIEENTLQRSGLPREFTLAMLIQKTHADRKVQFVLEIDPVLQTWVGSYPRWWLGLVRRYRAVRSKRGVDFRVSVGQRFEPVTSKRGFNFAMLEGSLDEHVYFSGRRVTIIPGGLQDTMDSSMPLPMPYRGGQDPQGIPGAVPIGHRQGFEFEFELEPRSGSRKHHPVPLSPDSKVDYRIQCTNLGQHQLQQC